MRHRDTAGLAAVPDPPKPGAEPQFEEYVDPGRQGLPVRLIVTLRHGLGLAVGGFAAALRGLPAERRRQPRFLLLRMLVGLVALPVNRELRRRPFAQQLRRRLEMLGPTYIKLGQILSLREDLLPRSITEELKNLFDRLPAISHVRFLNIVSEELGQPVEEVFAHVRSTPLGSASIGQTHLATTHDGRQVILKVVKPGVREILRRDTLLLSALGGVLQLFLARYQPRRVLREFCEYTRREVDLLREADNAETFAAAFRDQPDIVFPAIYREYCRPNLLCMEFLDGIQLTDPRAQALRPADRERLVDLGAEAIICMLYRDGFFHADLHPGNLIILPGPKCGFVDLGMVGRFDTDVKRTLLYYFHCLVAGDAENAANYLAALAETGPESDLRRFRGDVEELCRQWAHRPRMDGFSLARLILTSVAKGAEHRVYYPVEMVLMVKAIVTFEAVGNMLSPGLDVAKISAKHVNRVILQRFGPLRLVQESLTGLPELVDALAKSPRLLIEGLRLVERATHRPPENPLYGMRATLFGSACLVSGAVLVAAGGPWPVWAALFVAGVLLPLRRTR